MKKKWIIRTVLMVLVLSLIGYFVFGGTDPVPWKVVQAEVKQMTNANQVTATGVFRYKNTVEQQAADSGMLVERHVDVGDEIDEGDKLVDLEVSLGNDTETVEVTAITDGEVLSIHGDKGSYIHTGDPLIMFGEQDQLEIYGELSEFDYDSVAKGDKVSIESNAFNEVMQGKVTEVDQEVTESDLSDGSVIKMRVELEDTSGQNPIPGLQAFLTIETEQQTAEVDEAFMIPETALVEEEGLFYVYTVEDGSITKKEVTLQSVPVLASEDEGIGNDQFRIWVEQETTDEEILANMLEVDEGITADDWIIANPKNDIEEGSSVDTNSMERLDVTS
ncbi:efflux RND transporter periplasmic adaptor subunit [Gracilibacillus saliphilus]|uniref:efflux RND transporter periplasmic adaptor subunit n=1 Tax=Gracilibacillus saliphilus TaxID=543890 RepID=UPI0013D3197C|nr:HlyD family efflux transporter periplasmic adaptor subunit [Gracilibacillus saliphilus]